MMLLHLRGRGLAWSVPAGLAAVLLATWFGHWLENRPTFDHLARIPALVAGALVVAVVAAPGWHRVDDEVEGPVARPSRRTDLLATVSLISCCSLLAVVVMPRFPLERGGLELARDIVGLSGLGLLGAAFFGSRMAWVLPFAWAAGSYFSVSRTYWMRPRLAWPGWLMFPATYPATWVVALGLLAAGLTAFAWGGFMPRPRLHPLR